MAIEAIILAGGKGTRLASVVNDRPKVLAEVHGRPFLSFLLDQLIAQGIDRVVISTGYMAEFVESAFGHFYKNVPVAYSREHEPLGTGGALRLAVERMKSDPFFVLNGDSFCEFDLSGLVANHHSHKAAASLVLAKVADTSRFGQVQVDDAQRVLRFDEKGTAKGPGLINAGIYLISRDLALSIPRDIPVSLEKEIFPQWMAKGLFGFVTSGPFIDIGTPESYRSTEQFFAP